MASWFSVDSLKGLTDKVQSALPKFDSEMLEKLTLTTPELSAERQRIEEEERRKEKVRDTLAGMMPWETHDPERDILVEECRDAVLKLSSDRQTFFGPYAMPRRHVKLDDEKSSTSEENANQEEQQQDDHLMPSPESLEKLAKLEPLPVLLRDFDLDAHVGLINRLLKADPNLVKMQSVLSGGGEREIVFWRNYFFHCAYTRYEAGLSIDEIWSDHPPTFLSPVPIREHTEEEIHFEEVATPDDKAFREPPVTDPDAPFSKETATAAAATTSTGKDAPPHAVSDVSEGGADFEMVPEPDAATPGLTDDANLNVGDYELDELEAEIARELEN